MYLLLDVYCGIASLAYIEVRYFFFPNISVFVSHKPLVCLRVVYKGKVICDL